MRSTALIAALLVSAASVPVASPGAALAATDPGRLVGAPVGTSWHPDARFGPNASWGSAIIVRGSGHPKDRINGRCFLCWPG